MFSSQILRDSPVSAASMARFTCPLESVENHQQWKNTYLKQPFTIFFLISAYPDRPCCLCMKHDLGNLEYQFLVVLGTMCMLATDHQLGHTRWWLVGFGCDGSGLRSFLQRKSTRKHLTVHGKDTPLSKYTALYSNYTDCWIWRVSVWLNSATVQHPFMIWNRAAAGH